MLESLLVQTTKLPTVASPISGLKLISKSCNEVPRVHAGLVAFEADLYAAGAALGNILLQTASSTLQAAAAVILLVRCYALVQ